MRLEIETLYLPTDRELFDASRMTAGETKTDLGDGVSATWEGTRFCKAMDHPSVVEVTIDILAGTTGAVLANAIWAWLTKRPRQPPKTITIDRVEVEFEEGAVKRVILERMEQTDD